MPDPLRSKRHFITLFRPLIAAWMRRATNYRVMTPVPSNKEEPFLLISNHVSIYDLTYSLLQLQEMPVIVIHEIFQRNPIIAWLLRPFGLIWKQADLHDGKTIRQMKRAASAGRSILLYPEGDLTWDGDTGELPDALSKLVKYVALPVVMLTEKGAYMTYSRWAGGVRKGLVELHFKPCISAEELISLDDAQMMEKLRASFKHSERHWLQSQSPAPFYAAGHQARDLCKMLFLCPACKSAGQMVNSDTAISCLKCGFSAEVSPDLKLSRDAASKTGLTDIWEWHSHQSEEWRRIIGGALSDGTFRLSATLRKAELVRAIGGVQGIVTKGGFHSRFLKRPEKSKAIQASLSADGLKIKAEDGGEILSIPIVSMLSVRVLPMRIYKPNWLLISTEEGYYKLMFEGPGHPAYCWCTALRQMIGQEDACPHKQH